MNHTQNLHLPQWEETDRIMRTDFNNAMASIDTALAAVPRIAVGTYTGTGKYGESNPTTLTFNFQPHLVVISSPNNEYNALLCLPSVGNYARCLGQSRGHIRLSWSGNTVSWYNTDSSAEGQMNTTGTTYFYFAV